MRNLLLAFLVIGSTVLGGCNVDETALTGGSSSSARTTSGGSSDASYVYTFEFTGNGINANIDITGYSEKNYAGTATVISQAAHVFGVGTTTYTMNGKSLAATFHYNAGPGMLTIVTKKDGVVIRNDTLIISGAEAIITEQNL